MGTDSRGGGRCALVATLGAGTGLVGCATSAASPVSPPTPAITRMALTGMPYDGTPYEGMPQGGRPGMAVEGPSTRVVGTGRPGPRPCW